MELKYLDFYVNNDGSIAFVDFHDETVVQYSNNFIVRVIGLGLEADTIKLNILQPDGVTLPQKFLSYQTYYVEYQNVNRPVWEYRLSQLDTSVVGGDYGEMEFTFYITNDNVIKVSEPVTVGIEVAIDSEVIIGDQSSLTNLSENVNDLAEELQDLYDTLSEFEGVPGKAATVEVGTTTTGLPGTDANVTNSGTIFDAVLNFVIPRGEQGLTGPAGPIGATGATGEQGPIGATPDISIGDVQTGAPTAPAQVTLTGTISNPILNFVIPQGVQGPQGLQGLQGIQGEEGPEGPQGLGFKIAKFYTSITEMLNDTLPTEILVGEFAIILGDVESEDYGKLYVWTGSGYEYTADMSVQGIQGPKGDSGTEVQLRKSTESIQWKYADEDDTQWRDLVPLLDIKGDKGDQGEAATVAVGIVSTLPAGATATVTNVGTPTEAVFNFGIPQGIPGDNTSNSVDSLNDVELTNVLDDDILVYENGVWKNASLGQLTSDIPVNLQDLNNVNIGTPTAGQVLTYDGEVWKNDKTFYSSEELDDGQLDNRYYTETELDNGTLDSRYYTETELTNGVLDGRYYTETEVDSKLDLKLNTSLKGAVNGLAELDATGKVPSSQLPSYVDDVKEYDTITNFPNPGESDKIYIAIDTNLTYRWSGTQYVNIASSLALGETESTAYRGDRGKIAYDHSQIIEGNPHGTTFEDVGAAPLEHTHVMEDITDLDFPVDSVNGLTGEVVITASNTGYTNTDSNLTAETVKNAIDELDAKKLDISALSSSINLYPTTSASDIVGYFDMVSSLDDPRYNQTAANVPTGLLSGTDILVASLDADPGLFVGNPGVINVTTIGNIRKTAGNSNNFAEFFFRIYKRTAEGVETLLGTSDTTNYINPSTNNYSEFSAGALLNNGTFTDSDRVVIKYFANAVGTASGYEFQFGGTSPVRTLLPVPVSVIPSADASGVFVSTTNFDGLLSTDDNTVQLALDKLDDHLHDDRYYTELEVDTLLEDYQPAGDYATLVDGKVPASQLPSYVDDVLEFANLAAFPETGESDKIYIAVDTNLTYRWSGTQYVVIASSLALGETESTAYRGDRGKIAYDHSQITEGNPHGTTFSDVGAAPTVHEHNDLYYTETELDAGQLDNRYYTETELNNGQLNTIYYTESELDGGQLDTRYYTETELNNGQLDSRYFTETESDARFAPISHTHPITDLTDFDVVSPEEGQVLAYDGLQWTNTDLNLTTDLSSLEDVNIVGTPADNQILQYSGTDWTNKSSLNIDYIDVKLFDGDGPTPQAGRLYFDKEQGTASLGLLSGVSLQLGEELFLYGKAVVGEFIPAGTVVMFAGTTGKDPLFVKADMVSPYWQEARYIVGIATTNIDGTADDSLDSYAKYGYVAWFGRVNNIPTGTFTNGEVLYWDPTQSGGKLTNIPPVAPNPKVVVAAVLKASTAPTNPDGVLLVRPDFAHRLQELQDVNIINPNNNQVISYNAIAQRWENKLLTPSDIGAQPAGDYATLINGKISSDQLPAIAITDTFVVTTFADLSLLEVQTGDVAIVNGENKSYIYNGTAWVELKSPGQVSSVNGMTGPVELDAFDIGAAPTLHTHTASDITDPDNLFISGTGEIEFTNFNETFTVLPGQFVQQFPGSSTYVAELSPTSYSPAFTPSWLLISGIINGPWNVQISAQFNNRLTLYIFGGLANVPTEPVQVNVTMQLFDNKSSNLTYIVDYSTLTWNPSFNRWEKYLGDIEDVVPNKNITSYWNSTQPSFPPFPNNLFTNSTGLLAIVYNEESNPPSGTYTWYPIVYQYDIPDAYRVVISVNGQKGNLILNAANLGAVSVDDFRIQNWNAAYNWGDHSEEGYLTEVDAYDINTNNTPTPTSFLRGDNTWAEVSGGGTITEVDPVFTASPAANITSNDINNWNNSRLSQPLFNNYFVPSTNWGFSGDYYFQNIGFLPLDNPIQFIESYQVTDGTVNGIIFFQIITEPEFKVIQIRSFTQQTSNFSVNLQIGTQYNAVISIDNKKGNLLFSDLLIDTPSQPYFNSFFVQQFGWYYDSIVNAYVYQLTYQNDQFSTMQTPGYTIISGTPPTNFILVVDSQGRLQLRSFEPTQPQFDFEIQVNGVTATTYKSVISINGKKGNVFLNASDIGAQPIGNYATLVDGKISTNQLPALAITDTFVVSSEFDMLNLLAQTGDVAIRTDVNKTFILRGTAPNLLSDWQEILTPAGGGGGVTSVGLNVPNGFTVANSPVTSEGTLSIGYAMGYANGLPSDAKQFNWDAAYSHSTVFGNPHNTSFAQLSDKPTTVSGYGITDAAKITVSDTAPLMPLPGNLWWDSNTGKLKVYYFDGDSSQWVDATPIGSGQISFFSIVDKPTTISGYGITDAYTKVEVDNKDTIKEQNTFNSIKFWTGTQVQYDAIGTKDSNTLYFIT
jgi:hypothetical protein